MAVDYNRQYVGARYVPKLFDDGNGGMEWKANTYYEPLTVVFYNGSSYISRVPVPANIGNPVQSGEYWALSGNYNGAMMDLQNQVNDIKADVSEIQEFASNLANLRNRKFLFIGDSYGLNTTQYVGWNQQLKSAAEGFMLDITCISKGGCGFVSDGTNTWMAFVNTIEDIKQYTDIVILGGANDQSAGPNELVLATAVLKNWFMQNTNARIAYGFIGHSINRDTMVLMNTAYQVSYRACEISYYPVIEEAYTWLNKKSDFLSIGESDGRHPTSSGTKKIARGIIQWIFGCYAPLEEDYANNSIFYNKYAKYIIKPISIKQEANTYPAGYTTITLSYSLLPDYIFPQSVMELPIRVNIKGLNIFGTIYFRQNDWQVAFNAPQELSNVTNFSITFLSYLPYGII